MIVSTNVYLCIFRYKRTFFRNKEALATAETKLVSLMENELGPSNEEVVASTSSSLQTSQQQEEHSTSIIEQISKKIRLDKQVIVLCLL